MFRSRKTRLAALITGGALTFSASPALAQSQAVGQVNQGNLISALNNVSAQINDLRVLNQSLNDVDVRVVDVDDVANNNRVLNNALNRNDVDINVLRNSQVLQDFLNNNDVAVAANDVVAVNVLSGGDVVVFTQ